ncbi:MAG: ABC transporter substrate-binding protein, partial [Gammaproteobacteria bacterium]|nr:ABC transporter substrate-binding protein [Gammaproteobacteria bacterium]
MLHIALVSTLLLLSSVSLAEKPQYQHGISLLHDLKYRADFAHFAYSNPSAPKGGSLTLSTTFPIRNFSGSWGMGVGSAPGLHRTNDRLFVRSADELSAVYGLLADGIALSADRKSLFIRMNPTARWHDGVPITTRDVHFSYHALASFATSSIFSRAYLDSWIESFEVINDRELVIRHRDVFTHSNLLAMTTFPVKPAHYYAERGDPYAISLEVPLGNGPYRIAGYSRDHVEYERVKDYWARDLPVNRGRHNFD